MIAHLVYLRPYSLYGDALHLSYADLFFQYLFYYQDCSSSFFKKYQDFPTKRVDDVEQFTIDGNLFLAFASYGDKQIGYNLDSVIYKMNDVSETFSLYQTIDTIGCYGMKYFTIADEHFLAVANHYDGHKYQLNSLIYRWNGYQFVYSQNIITSGATDFNFFKVFTDFFLVVTNCYNGAAFRINSVIYKWRSNHFEKFQEIATEGAMGSAAFVINNEHFLVFANLLNTESPVFKWSGGSFVKLQSLKTNGAHDVKSFSIDGGTFLAFANHYEHGKKYNTDSFVYKWINAMFVLFQSIPTRGAAAWHPFVICGQTYLSVANHNENVKGYKTQSVIYKFAKSQFIKYQGFSTFGATSLTSFVYKGHTYFVISNYDNSSSLYKWV